MPDSKITALTSIGASTDPANDPLVLVDVSDTSMAASGTTKKVTLNQLLGASGTATLASATITGDLTVDTSTLKVDSANNRVGIQITSPTAPLEVGETSGTALRLRRLTSGNTIDVNFYNTNTTVGDVAGIRCDGDGLANTYGAISFWTTQTPNSLVERYRISSVGVHTWQNVGGVAGTAMTLNSTGLGVGRTPVYKLDVSAPNGNGIRYRAEGSSATIYMGDFSGVPAISTGTVSPIIFGIGGAEAMRIDAASNVGVGVTPSAWISTFKALQLGLGGAVYSQTDFRSIYLASNAYVDSGGTLKYIGTDKATTYRQYDGIHAWFNAPSGTAGNAITLTQAMTLDASGNLLVGTTNSASNAGIGLKASYSATAPYYATVGSSNASNVYSYLLYSTTDAAFKFYVSYSGTVSATNGTISAISDQRLKENVQDIDVGLGAILALKPRKFDWKEGKGKNIKGDRGFIAQEFEQVFPNLVDEWKDNAPEGEAPYKSVRQDLIPVLVKAIQELTARVEALEA